MKWSEVIGNETTVSALRGMVDSDHIPHAIMLHENDGGGAFRIALAFLQYLFCRHHEDSDSCGACPACNKITKLIHPDIQFVFPVSTGSKVSDHPTSSAYMQWFRELVVSNPDFTENQLTDALGIEGKSSLIAVDEAKIIIDRLNLSALEGGYKAVVVYLPEKMNEATANRLLKSIEEPPEQTQFIFITHSPEKVLRTISSRCMGVRVLPSGAGALALADGPAFGGSEEGVALEALLEAIAAKNLTAALGVVESIASLPGRESAKNFCLLAGGAMRNVFLLQQGLTSLAESVPQSEDELLRRFASSVRKSFPRLAMPLLDKAHYYVGRNVNSRLLFTDLVCKLYQIA